MPETVWTVERVEALIAPFTLQASNLKAIAYHVEKGEPNGGVEKIALASGLRNEAKSLESAEEIIRWLLDENAELRKESQLYRDTRREAQNS